MWGNDRLLSDHTWQKLCECLGLSEYEAKLYVSLLGEGSANARTLSMTSGVPRTKVYSVLKKLIDIGLVFEIPEEPRKFTPTPRRTALKSYLHSYQNMVDNLLSVTASLEEILKRPKIEKKPKRNTIWIIEGREEILRKIRQMLSKAKRSVLLVTNEDGLIILYRSFNRMFDELADRSVRVKIITPEGSTSQHVLSELRYTCKVEENSFQLPLVFLFTDEKQLLLANLESDSVSPNPERDKGIFSDDGVLSEMICSLILHYGWRTQPSLGSNRNTRNH